VDCAEIRQGFLTGEVPSGSPVAEHLSSCPHCPELFQNAALLGRRLAISASLLPARVGNPLAAVSSAITAEHGPRAFLRSR
jgi:hypothetical protein